MGMEISSRRLQEADARMQEARDGVERPAAADDRERFERAMRGSGENGEQEGQGDRDARQGSSRQDAPSPQSLLDSLFGARMPGLQQTQAAAPQAAPAATEVEALVNELVDRILVSEPGKGLPEVRITLARDPLAGTELALARAQDGQLFVRLSCADPAAFRAAVGAQDSLRDALERSGEDARVEIVRSGGGNESDARQQSRGHLGYMPHAE